MEIKLSHRLPDRPTLHIDPEFVLLFIVAYLKTPDSIIFVEPYKQSVVLFVNLD